MNGKFFGHELQSRISYLSKNVKNSTKKDKFLLVKMVSFIANWSAVSSYRTVVLSNNSTNKLLKLAKDAQQNAYAPYSKFFVGASIMADNGKQYSGCNVENVAFPLGQCAEAGAIAAMIRNGGKKIHQILIVGPTEKICPPCGGCRQKIHEFSTAETKVLLSNSNGDITTLTMAQLMPFAFDLD